MLNALSVGMKRHPDIRIAIFDQDASSPAIISRLHEMMRACFKLAKDGGP